MTEPPPQGTNIPNVGSHSSGPSDPPETLVQAALRLAWQLKPSRRVGLLVIVILAVTSFAVWQSFPDKAKERFLGGSPTLGEQNLSSTATLHQSASNLAIKPASSKPKPSSTVTSSDEPDRVVRAHAPSEIGEAWLIFRGVDLFDRFPNAQVRVIANVNDTTFTYPTLPGVEWLGIGPTMAPQQFRLPPPGPHGYRIRFEMLLRRLPEYPEDVNTLKSTETVFITSLPVERTYSLHLVDGNVRAPAIVAVVNFTVSSDPNAR